MLLSDPTTKKAASARAETWRQGILDMSSTFSLLRGPLRINVPARSSSRLILVDCCASKIDLQNRPSPEDDGRLPQPGVGRQLVDDEPRDIGARYLAAIDACEIGNGPDSASGRVVDEHAGPDDDPIE